LFDRVEPAGAVARLGIPVYSAGYLVHLELPVLPAADSDHSADIAYSADIAQFGSSASSAA